MNKSINNGGWNVCVGKYRRSKNQNNNNSSKQINKKRKKKERREQALTKRNIDWLTYVFIEINKCSHNLIAAGRSGLQIPLHLSE